MDSHNIVSNIDKTKIYFNYTNIVLLLGERFNICSHGPIRIYYY